MTLDFSHEEAVRDRPARAQTRKSSGRNEGREPMDAISLFILGDLITKRRGKERKETARGKKSREKWGISKKT